MVSNRLVSAVIALLLCLAAPAATLGQGTVTGRVVQSGTLRPVAGAQLSIPGTGLGALANNDGRYLIVNVPVGQHTVRVQIIGYATQDQTVTVSAGQTVTADFTLETQALGLDEIVVTGTAGGQQRRAIGNVVGSVSATESIERSAPASLQQLLAGQVAGVDMHVGGGNVGTGGAVQIRGAGSLALNTQPLLYIDGVRANAETSGQFQGAGNTRLNDINPEDIERIEIIKGPAAATLYGTEASNGVIQIITKKGSAGAPTVEATVRQGANWFASADQIRPNYGLDPTRTQVIEQNPYQDELDAGRNPFRTGMIQAYGVNVRGGLDRLNYYLSGTHDSEEGYHNNNEVNRTSLRSNLQVLVNDRFDVSMDVGVIRMKTTFAPDGTSGTYGIIPNIVWGTPATRNTPSRGFMVGPPEIQDMIDAREELHRATAAVSAIHRPTDWLTQRLVVGFDWTDAKQSTFYPRLPEDSPRFFSGNSTGNKQLSNSRDLNQTLDYSATATFDVTPEVSSTTSFGAQYFTREEASGSASGRNLPTSAVSTVSAAAITTGSESFVENNTFGVYLQETLGWRNQAFVTAALRADANSAFGESFEAAYYPKLSGTWVVSDADFWSLDAINGLRLRAAWGRSGLQPDAFAAIRTYAPTTGPNDVPAVTPGNVGNPDLKPEVGQEIELGFDLSGLQNRAALEFTFYDKTTKDLILAQRVTPSLGFPGSRFINAGEVNNKGIELSLELTPLRTSSAQLVLGATGSYNSNELIALGGGLSELQADTRGRWRHKVGYPLGAMWTKYIASAEWRGGRLVNIMCKGSEEQNFAPMPCPQAPFHHFGDPGPKWQGSFTQTLTLGNNLTFNALWVFVKDRWRFSTTDWYRDRTQRNSLEAQQYLLGSLDPVRAAEILTLDIENIYFQKDDFLRLRDLSVSYNLPTSWVEGFGLSRASVTVSGRNLLLFHDDGFTDLDPEVKRIRNGSNFQYQRWEQVQSPLPASFVTTLRVTF